MSGYSQPPRFLAYRAITRRARRALIEARTMFPQEPLQFVRVQSVQHLEKIQDARFALGQFAAVTKNLNASIRAKSQFLTRPVHLQEHLVLLRLCFPR